LVFLPFMKLPDVILLSVTVAFVLIGIHQIRTVGFGNAYWAIMLALVFFFLYNLRRRKS
jgi:hypothetical protein